MRDLAPGRFQIAVCIPLTVIFINCCQSVVARDKVYPGNDQTSVDGAAANQTSGLNGTTSLPQVMKNLVANNDTSQHQPDIFSLLQTARPQPLRLKFDYTALQNGSSNLTAVQVDELQQRFGPATIAILAKFLQVRLPQQGVLKGPQQDYAKLYCEREALQALKDGVNDTDILMVVVSSSNCTQKTFAWSASCDWDLVTSRPTLGVMVVCPGFFKQSDGEQLATMVHEVIHALGFANAWFQYWYDPDTGKPYKKVYQLAAGEGEPGYLVTPRAKAYAQQYFGCADLPGAPLDAESMSHWNQRAIALDLMVPHVVDTLQPSRLTPFTLKALEDTGWYVANYEAAEEPEHGHGAGCPFTMNSCAAYKQSDADTSYVCLPDEKALDACTPDARGIAYCDYGFGGCLAPVVNTLKNPDYPLLDCTDANSFFALSQTHGDLQRIQAIGGSTGVNSRCLTLWDDICTATGSDCNGYREAVCAATSCPDQTSMVTVAFKQPDGKAGSINCTRGELVDLSKQLPDMFRTGKFKCPDPVVVCPTLGCTAENCPVGNGNCWDGQCKCRFMFSGQGCTSSLLPPALPQLNLEGVVPLATSG